LWGKSEVKIRNIRAHIAPKTSRRLIKKVATFRNWSLHSWGSSDILKTMKRRDFLEKWGLTSLKLNFGFLEGEFAPQDADRNAAWELYVELLTRVTTQNLLPEEGDEGAALSSAYQLFPLTREILRRNGSSCGEFAKLAIPVLNQIIRPFTAKWHRLSTKGAFENGDRCREFRAELSQLQVVLRDYTRALAAMAQVEDLTVLEEVSK
jgi:hypothetical protein